MTDAHVQKMPALLTIRGLKKSFGTTLVLNGVDLDVHKGEVVTILGPSGSGKTTLLRCVNFLESYDEGSIKISDQEVGYYDSINPTPYNSALVKQLTIPSYPNSCSAESWSPFICL
jgi:ABC-type Fe3+/spermidine/putrescine transport system ATPase subunit